MRLPLSHDDSGSANFFGADSAEYNRCRQPQMIEWQSERKPSLYLVGARSYLRIKLLYRQLNINKHISCKQQRVCAGNSPESPVDPYSKLKFYPKKLATGGGIVIQPLNNDALKLLKTEGTVDRNSQSGWTRSGTHHSCFFSIHFIRHRKRKHLGGHRQHRRNRRKRPRLVPDYSTSRLQTKKHKCREYLYLKSKCETKIHSRSESAVCKQESNLFCFHVDWGSLTPPLNPREQYLGKLVATMAKVPVHNTVEFDVSCKEVTSFKFEDLWVATNGFDSHPLKSGGKLIGSGGYSDVFYAKIIHYGIENDVAVKKFKQPQKKRLSATLIARKQFPTEVGILMRVNAENIVQLIGLSTDGPELCIVYEYMLGGTLAQSISKDCCSPLHWKDRMKVTIGVCRAVKYLHTEMFPPTIHRDIKSSNILLSSDCIAKLSDFGLACSIEYESDPDESFEESGSISVGTRCYMPPEAFKGRFSTKTDVYALGVVVYEVLTGLPPYSRAKKKDLVTFVRELCSEEDGTSVLLDPRSSWPSFLATEILEVAEQCTDYDSSSRPRITEVLRKLEELLSNTLKPSVP